jgi:CHAT domain-containing protein
MITVGARSSLIATTVGLFVALPLTPAIAGVCDPVMADQHAVFEATRVVRGSERLTVQLPVAVEGTVLVLAREQGVDITLEVWSKNDLIQRADSPIARSGIQRTIVEASPSAQLTLALVGKERTHAAGSVELRVLPFSSSSKELCIEVQRILAHADSTYARGQVVTRAAGSGISDDAVSAYRSAASQYATAAYRLESSSASELLAQSEHALAAVLYDSIQDWSGSDSWAPRAAAVYAAIRDPLGRAQAQGIEAAALLEIATSVPVEGEDARHHAGALETLHRARSLLRELAAFHAQRGEGYEQALALNNIGLSYYYEGANPDAIRAYGQALQIYQRLGETFREVQVLQNIALAEYELGHVSEALARYARVMRIIAPADDPSLFAAVLDNSGTAHWASGNIDAALREYGQALELERATQSLREQARTLHNIGSVYAVVGDRKLALEFYSRALELRTTQLDGRGRVASLRAFGNVLLAEGRAADALKSHQEALSLSAAPRTRTRLSIQISRDLEQLGRHAESRQVIDGALNEIPATDETARAAALLERGRYRTTEGQERAGESDLRTALATFRKYEEPLDEFEAWMAIAQLKHKLAADQEAFAALRHALALADTVRLQSANPEFRATLAQPLRPAFDLQIEILAEEHDLARSLGHDAEAQRLALQALRTAEQARARTLRDFQTISLTAASLSPGLIDRRRALYRDLSAQRLQLEARLERSDTNDPRVEALRLQIAELRRELDDVEAQIAAASSHSNAQQGSPAIAAVDSRSVPSGTAFLEYWFGAKDAFAWVLTSDAVALIRLGPSEDLNRVAQSLHDVLRAFGSKGSPLPWASQLYQMAVKPCAPYLAGKHILLLVPDSLLHYVPFGALMTDDSRPAFLIERFDIAIVPSIWSYVGDDPGRIRPIPPKQMLLVADPIYDPSDERLVAVSSAPLRREAQGTSLPLFRGMRSGQPLARLTGTAKEAAAIATLLPPGTIDRLEGVSATKERFLQSGPQDYRFIHIASHGATDAEIPQLSAVVLSSFDAHGQRVDDHLLAADFMGLRLNADVVVLSACDTALGRNVPGEGLVGLRYVVLARGARSVISSLWPVPDEAAVQLMANFYAALLRRHLPVGAALSEAMRSSLAESRGDPSSWASFTATLGQLSDFGPLSQPHSSAP